MFRLLCTTLLDQAASDVRPSTAAVETAAATHRYFILPHQKAYSHSCIDYSDEQSSVTVSFLTSSCGFPAGAARSIAQRLQLKSAENARSVVALLKAYGFGEAQIMNLVTRAPRILACQPIKNLKPKLEFYRGIGLVGAALGKILAANPSPLLCSLESRLLPNVKFLKSILGTDEKVVAAIKNSPALIIEDFTKLLLPRIESLRADGVADDVIVSLLAKYGDTFSRRSYRFMEAVDTTKKLGIPPSRLMFAHAVGVFVELPLRLWKERIANFKSLGWTEDQIMAAFARQPKVASSSTEKMRRNLKFVEGKLGWDPEYTSRYPIVLMMSMERRLMPRYAVLRILVSRGLVKTGFSANPFMMLEKKFLKQFVIPYKEKAPEIADAFRGLAAELKV